ncbi:MAG: hypothetical protein H0W11_12090 [Gemmatimonadetes bacterium]|nr:hypothetical protein [Gemmatimonadota bacterium]
MAVMVGALMEHVLAPQKIDGIFSRTARVQYERQVLFSTMVELMSEVVCGVRPSVNAAYRRKKQQQEIAVSIRALYSKLSGVEPAVNRALVRETAAQMAEIVRHLGGAAAPLRRCCRATG